MFVLGLSVHGPTSLRSLHRILNMFVLGLSVHGPTSLRSLHRILNMFVLGLSVHGPTSLRSLHRILNRFVLGLSVHGPTSLRSLHRILNRFGRWRPFRALLWLAPITVITVALCVNFLWHPCGRTWTIFVWPLSPTTDLYCI